MRKKLKQIYNYKACVCENCGIDQYVYYIETIDEYYCNYCLNTVTAEVEEEETYNQQCMARNA